MTRKTIALMLLLTLTIAYVFVVAPIVATGLGPPMVAHIFIVASTTNLFVIVTTVGLPSMPPWGESSIFNQALNTAHKIKNNNVESIRTYVENMKPLHTGNGFVLKFSTNLFMP